MDAEKRKKHIKIIDVEKIDERDDAKGGPVDTVDIFDDVTGDDGGQFRPRNKKAEDIDNPLSDEDFNIVNENMFTSEPDKDESE
ncbi:hypothetical protein [uncultured Bartonella sp.]|uniref:hypothetical protein n=1 Tax=uncultured Bartonella sp. TaxID=104108 RepID=UPI0026200D5C|nr:hypothetical protein [uncultured Bartonella sp.]